jgi:geranylgeranyl diphosphate synthase type II
MRSIERLEAALRSAVERLTADGCPPRLAEAIEYAVFPPGNRLRPRLCVAVANALGSGDGELAEAAAVSLEFLHCASLIQDDLPAFDDAADRRGRPSTHEAFDVPTAILAADALIIGAFETIAWSSAQDPSLAAALTLEIARGTGAPHGAVAGQGWEGETDIDLVRYHRSKTAALFEAATAAGAIVAGHDPVPWRRVGHWLGRAYQIADDIADEGSNGERSSDAALGRPNALRAFGRDASVATLEHCIQQSLETVPPCRGDREFRTFLEGMLERFRPPPSASREHAHRPPARDRAGAVA